MRRMYPLCFSIRHCLIHVCTSYAATMFEYVHLITQQYVTYARYAREVVVRVRTEELIGRIQN